MTAVSVAEGARKCFAMPPLSAIASAPSSKPVGRPARHRAAVRVEVPRRLLRLRRRAQRVGRAGDLHRHCRILRERAIALGAVLARLGEEHALCRHFGSDAAD